MIQEFTFSNCHFVLTKIQFEDNHLYKLSLIGVVLTRVQRTNKRNKNLLRYLEELVLPRYILQSKISVSDGGLHFQV